MLMISLVSTASAHESSNWGNHPCGWSDGRWSSCGGGGHQGIGTAPSAPELDPSVLGSGTVILTGGLILLNERRRNRK